jgi:predicted small lipoprotein YifL
MKRVLLALLMAAVLSLTGCEKKEPTLEEQARQLKKEAEKTAEQVQEEARDITEEALQRHLD